MPAQRSALRRAGAMLTAHDAAGERRAMPRARVARASAKDAYSLR